MDVDIREASPGDAEAMVRILNPIIESGRYSALTSPLTLQAEQAFIESFPERGILHVAVSKGDERVVGFQNVAPFSPYPAFSHVGEIGTFVDLTLLRNGIAQQLFRATFDVARRRGYEKFFTYVRADNPGALSAYLSQGFRVVGTAERHVRVGETYIDEVMIEKWL